MASDDIYDLMATKSGISDGSRVTAKTRTLGEIFGTAPANTEVAERAAVQNPMSADDKDLESIGENFNEQVAPFVSGHKIAHLYVGYNAADFRILKKDNWKTFGSIGVHPSVPLICDNSEFQFSYSLNASAYTFNELQEKSKKLVSSAAGMINENLGKAVESIVGGIDKVADFGVGASGKTFAPVLDGFQIWDKPDPVQLGSSLSFTFRFGQAGLFSGLEEVVRPIIAIASLFASAQSDNNTIIPPYPTMEAIMASLGSSALAGLSKGVQSTLDKFRKEELEKKEEDNANDEEDEDGSRAKDKAAKAHDAVLADISAAKGAIASADAAQIKKTFANNSAVQAAVQLKSSLYNAYTALAKTQLNASRMGVFRIGKMVMGPFYVGSVSYSFDFNGVDEDGYPTKGTITLNGLKTPYLATNNTIDVFGIDRDGGASRDK